jgi:tetratricopeptide repeat protein
MLAAGAAVAIVAASAAPARADDAQAARELFTQGNTFFDLGQFEKAIDAWQQGYQLKNDPGFLYNIAQAYRTTGDTQKAIFFYKRYLSNAPKARNREEVEQKIAALQKQLAAQEQAKQIQPPGPLGPSNPAPPRTVPAPADLNPAPAGGQTMVPPAVSPVTAIPAPAPARVYPIPETTVPTAAPATFEPAGPIDFAVSAGFDTWSKGVQGTANPSFAFALAGGYTFGHPGATTRFKLGALFGYTFLSEAESKETFLSFLIEPTLDFRLARRFRLDVDVGIGVLSIAGLNDRSALLDHANGPLAVDGTQALFEARVGVEGIWDVGSAWSIFVGPAIANSPKKQHFYAEITRVEILGGLAYHL